MSDLRTNRLALLVLAAPMALLIGARDLGAEPGEPSVEMLRSLVEGYAYAVETNNRELALWYVHPRSLAGLPQASGGRSIGSRDRKTYIEHVSAAVELSA